MQYDVIVLGATFAAAGMLSVLGEECMALERRPQAGYEFISALRVRGGADLQLRSPEAMALRELIRAKGGLLYDCAAPLYDRLLGQNVLLGMTPVSVEPCEGGFEVTAHGVSGWRSYRARRVVDTRIHADMVQSKSLNLLLSAAPGAPRICMEGVTAQEYGIAGDVIVRCHVPADADYVTARERVTQVLSALPEGYRLVYMADEFDCDVRLDAQCQCGGIERLPSGAWDDPIAAFDAGVLYARGEAVQWTYR